MCALGYASFLSAKPFQKPQCAQAYHRKWPPGGATRYELGQTKSKTLPTGAFGLATGVGSFGYGAMRFKKSQLGSFKMKRFEIFCSDLCTIEYPITKLFRTVVRIRRLRPDHSKESNKSYRIVFCSEASAARPRHVGADHAAAAAWAEAKTAQRRCASMCGGDAQRAAASLCY